MPQDGKFSFLKDWICCKPLLHGKRFKCLIKSSSSKNETKSKIESTHRSSIKQIFKRKAKINQTKHNQKSIEKPIPNFDCNQNSIFRVPYPPQHSLHIHISPSYIVYIILLPLPSHPPPTMPHALDTPLSSFRPLPFGLKLFILSYLILVQTPAVSHTELTQSSQLSRTRFGRRRRRSATARRGKTRNMRRAKCSVKQLEVVQ